MNISVIICLPALSKELQTSSNIFCLSCGSFSTRLAPKTLNRVSISILVRETARSKENHWEQTVSTSGSMAIDTIISSCRLKCYSWQARTHVNTYPDTEKLSLCKMPQGQISELKISPKYPPPLREHQGSPCIHGTLICTCPSGSKSNKH